MIKIIKIGNLIYENIEPYFVDENGNEVWNIPNDVSKLQEAIKDTLVWMEKQRLQEVLDQYGYFSLADVQLYVNQNDAEAQGLLSWYKSYDDGIWQYIDNDLKTFTTVDELLSLDMKSIEQQIFDQSIKASPLP